ncbi:lysophospholipid acyltransferase family protein [Caldicellulosiruptoraceae bacterium PP1]
MKYNFLQNILRKMVFIVAKPMFFLSLKGKENIPNSPYIICANHRSYWDPVFIIISFEKPVIFMAKSELFRLWFLSPILKLFGAFPVQRGKSDIKAIKKSVEVIKEGKILGIFPEGKRNKTDQTILKGEKGVATIVKLTNVPVLPVAICGEIKPFHKVSIVIGNPIKFNKEDNNEEIVEKIMLSIKELIEKEK